MGVLSCCVKCGSLCAGKYTSAGCPNNTPVRVIEELPVRRAQSIEAEEADLVTGDIILVHCTHEFGKMAQILDHTCWDHVAMIVRTDEAAVALRIKDIASKPLPTDVAEYTAEASGVHSKYQDPQMSYSAPKAGGVELLEAVGVGTFSYPLEECLVARGFKYKYTMIRKLIHGPTGRRGLDAEATAKVHEAVSLLWGRPYEKNIMESLGAILRGGDPAQGRHVDKSKEALDSIFCSELVAEIYQRAGLLKEEDLNSNEVLPRMFQPGGAIDDRLSGTEYRLGSELLLVGPSGPSRDHLERRRDELFGGQAPLPQAAERP